MTINRLETDAPMMQAWEIELEAFALRVGKMMPAGMSMAVLTSAPASLQVPGGTVVTNGQTLCCRLLNTDVGVMTAWTQMLLGMTIDQLRKYQPEGGVAYAAKLEGVLQLLNRASGSNMSLGKKPVVDPASGA